MESFFVDVGQGACSVILLGGRRAIVIDCGRRSAQVLELLSTYRISYLECLALSHNDSDHGGAAAAVLTQFRRAVGRVAFVKDSRLFDTQFWARISEDLESGALTREQVVRLEREDRPRCLFKDPMSGASLRVFAPNCAGNLIADFRGRPNDTSAVLVHSFGRACVVYAGDASVDEWMSIRSARGARALTCDILTVPHHGGKIHGSAAELERFYRDCVRPRYAIVSAGTGNSYHHPRQDVLRALSVVGCTTICTQITTKCCQDLEQFRQWGLPKVLPGQSVTTVELSRKGKSRNVACAGTVHVFLTSDGVLVDRLSEHQALVDEALGDAPSALCRRFVSAPAQPAAAASI